MYIHILKFFLIYCNLFRLISGKKKSYFYQFNFSLENNFKVDDYFVMVVY